jgi:beta-1,2-mannosidase
MKQRYRYLIAILFFSGCSTKPTIFEQLSYFNKPVNYPILSRDSSAIFYDSLKNETVRWKKADVFNPAAIIKNDSIYVLSRCEDNPGAALGNRTSRIGISVSLDGIHFNSFNEPVLYPSKDSFQQFDYPGGCEDPRIVQTEDGLYVLAYTSWNYKVPRLSIAFSKDLFHWEKKGPAFANAYNHRFLDSASKSASMITRMEGNKIVLAKIRGRYWMYWGEYFVNLAWSENLYDWYPLVDSSGFLKKIMQTRPNHFDSDLDECGPPALMTDRGIMLIYNGKNANGKDAELSLPKGTYSVGRVFFDPKDLETILIRSDDPFLKPTLPHEISGQYAAGTTFAEGLVYYKEKWFLYYGTADSFVGVAVSKYKSEP